MVPKEVNFLQESGHNINSKGLRKRRLGHRLDVSET